MESGSFPGQLAALRAEVRAIEAEERQRGRRRALLAGAVAGAVGVATGGLGGWVANAAAARRAGNRTGEEPGARMDPRTPAPSPRLLQLADGPLDALVADWFLVGSELEQHRAEVLDPLRAMVLSRLASYAAEHDTVNAARIRGYLLRTQFGPGVRAALAPWRGLLAKR